MSEEAVDMLLAVAASSKEGFEAVAIGGMCDIVRRFKVELDAGKSIEPGSDLHEIAATAWGLYERMMNLKAKTKE